ncbi:putative GNAT family acetyltransferase [Hypoxylon sp. FL0543]|nr:putative GNAT family acetyltransferase [Hypoxylon sp. FL0543]
MSTAKPLNVFRSERLVYRPVNGISKDGDFVNSIYKDAEAQSGANYGLLRPESLMPSFKLIGHLGNHLLSAIICLPARTPEDGGSTFEDEGSTFSEEPIGIVCLESIPAHLARHRCTELHVDIAEKHRGQGYGSEAISWSLWYAFHMAGLHRVQILAFSFNDGASKLCELGFKEEGRQREVVWFNGGWHDCLVYGMLEDDWRNTQKGPDMKRENDTQEEAGTQV